jgi:tetratricopeptide (TPR) repeat protein
LLTGRTPFDSKELLASGLDAMRKTIREKEPVRPSTRLATLQGEELTTTAKRRSAETSKLMHLLRGDLDWIVMKCLEKDRTRRYETANGLAADIDRHLNNEPVVARPPSTVYRFQKAFRRNKLVFAAGGVVIAALILGVIGTTIGLVHAERQRRVAETAQRLAQQNFDQARAAVGDLLAVSDEDLFDLPGMQPLRVKLMRAAIDRYRPFLERPSADPAPRAELARLYVKYGFTATENGTDYTTVAVPAFESAFAIQEQLVREHPHDRAFRSDLGWTYIFYVWHGDSSSAKSQQAREKAVAIFEALVQEDPSDPLARADLAWALSESTWGSGAPRRLASMERSIAIREQLVKEFPQSAEFRRDLANVLSFYANDLKDPAAALATESRAIHLQETLVADMEQHLPAIWSPAHPQGSEARLLKPSLIWMKRDVALGCVFAARQHAQLKQWPEALASVDRAKGIYRQLVEQNPSMREFVVELCRAFRSGAEVAEQSGDVDGALARRREAVSYLRGRLPADDPEVADALAGLASTLLLIGKYSEAESMARESLAIIEKKLPDDWRAFNAKSVLGGSLLGQKRYAEAEPLLLSGYEGMEQRKDKIPAERKSWLKETLRRLVQLYEATDRPAQAAEWKRKLEETTTP